MRIFYRSLIVILLTFAFTFLFFSLTSKKLSNSIPKSERLSTQTDGQIAGEQISLTDEAGRDFDELVSVTRVIDGDTIEIEGGIKVRYIGIDTPESVNPEQPVECFAALAGIKNKELVEGRMVRLEKDLSETDKYGRLLRYVYLGDVFVNDLLVKEGYAKSATFPPDVKHQALFAASEKFARENNLGLWNECQSDTNVAGVSSCVIKGNISVDDEKIYHLPGQKFYDKTVIDGNKGEKYFCSEEEAVEAGWRKSKV